MCTKNSHIKLIDICIDIEKPGYSPMVREALTIIEQNYLRILNTNEITKILNITECTLSREFNKCHLPGPKKY